MGERPRTFWVSTSFAAIASAGVLALGAHLLLRLEPRAGVQLLGAADLWLLAVFTTGVLGVLIGCSVALGGWFRGSRIREGFAAWEKRAAELDAAKGWTTPVVEGRNGSPEGVPTAGESGIDPARWMIVVGCQLLAIYTVAWWTFR